MFLYMIPYITLIIYTIYNNLKICCHVTANFNCRHGLRKKVNSCWQHTKGRHKIKVRKKSGGGKKNENKK